VTNRLRSVAVVAALGSVAYLAVISLARPFVGGDTPFVLDGTNAFLTCVSHHDYHACGYTGALNYWGLMSPIGWWPLLQHVPDLIAIGLGADGHPARTRVLATLSVVGVVVSIGLGWLVLKRFGRERWFWAYLVVAISGPILAFERQTAGEMLAMGLLVGLVAATLLQAPPAVVALAALLACWTKETSYAFVAAFGVLALVLARRRTGAPIRRHVIWGAGGMAIGIAAASLFNIVRFGSVLNTNYLDSQLRTPGIARKLEYVLAVLASPSGGLLFFWPAAVVLIAAACLVGLRRNRLPAVVVLVASGALMLGFASWWTPFGWSAYGPRLQLPWVLPIVLILLVAYGPELEHVARRAVTSTAGLALILVVAFACALPHIGYMWKEDALVGYFGQENPPCDAPWRGGVEKWHRCQSRLLWTDRPLPLYSLGGLRTLGGAFTAVIVALGLAGSLLLFREGLTAPRLRAERRREQREARSVDPRTAPAR